MRCMMKCGWNFLGTVSSSGTLGSCNRVRGSYTVIPWPQSAMKCISVAVVITLPVDACM
jgi:hypothetical protein